MAPLPYTGPASARGSWVRRCLMAHEPNAAGPSLRESRGAPAAAAVPDDLRALRAVVEGTAAGTGQEFFRSLVRHLAEAIGVHYAAVCEFLVRPRGRVLAVWDRDHVVEDLHFDFATSPAAEVLTSGLAHFPTGVLRRFPQA